MEELKKLTINVGTNGPKNNGKFFTKNMRSSFINYIRVINDINDEGGDDVCILNIDHHNVNYEAAEKKWPNAVVICGKNICLCYSGIKLKKNNK